MKILKTTSRYIKLFWEFNKLTLSAQMEYKLNFISAVLVEVAYMMIKSMYAVICYQNDVHIGSLDPDRICLIIGTYALMTAIYMIVWEAYYIMPDKIRSGAIDLVIVKPVSSQFLLTMTQVNWGLVFTNAAGGIIMICIGWRGSGIPVTIPALLGFLFLIFCSSLLTYSLFLIPDLFAFKLLSVRGMITFAGALWDFNNMPMALYGRAIRIFGLFVFPVLIISNWPGLLVMGELSPGMIAFGIFISAFWFIVVRLLWKKSVKSYTSANG